MTAPAASPLPPAPAPTADDAPPSSGWWRWAALALAALLVILTGLAVSSQSREEFERSQSDPNGQGEGEGQPQPGELNGEGDPFPQSSPPGDSSGERGQESESQLRSDQRFDGWRSTTETVTNWDLIFDDDGNLTEVNVTPSGTITATEVNDGDVDEDDLEEGIFSGIRVTEDGAIEMVDWGEEESGDFLVTPNESGDGLIFNQVDGPRVLVLLDDENVTMIDDDGVRTMAGVGETVTIGDAGVPGAESGNTESFVLSVGTLVVSAEPDGRLVASQLDPDAAASPGTGELIRIIDGAPEVVARESIVDGDVTLEPRSIGFERVGSDGQVVRFEPSDHDGGLTAHEVDEDGVEVALTPDGDRRVQLSDGTTVFPISPVEPPPAVTPQGFVFGSMPWRLFFISIGLLALCSILLALYLHLDLRRDPVPTVLVDQTPPDRFAQLLDELRVDPDPTRAVRRAFRVAEVGLGRLPARRPTETPFEWLGRVDGADPHLAEPVETLCNLFAKARFAPSLADETDRHAMVDALAETQRRATAGAIPAPADAGSDSVSDSVSGSGSDSVSDSVSAPGGG